MLLIALFLFSYMVMYESFLFPYLSFIPLIPIALLDAFDDDFTIFCV